MAFNQYKLRLIYFTAPADGRKFTHLMHLNAPDDDAFVAGDFLRRVPDGKITKWEYVRNEGHVHTAIAQLREENHKKGDYRELSADELRLTENQVRALSRQFGDVALRANIVQDPNGNPLIPVGERAAVMERAGMKPRPATADHAVAEALPELREEFERKVGPVDTNA